MPIKVKIAEKCKERGISTAYKLQKALNLSPTVANRLFKGDFARIDILTLDRLCRFLECQPAHLLEFEHRIVSLDKYRGERGSLPDFPTFSADFSDDDLISIRDACSCVRLTTDQIRQSLDRKTMLSINVNRRTYIPVWQIRQTYELFSQTIEHHRRKYGVLIPD